MTNFVFCLYFIVVFFFKQKTAYEMRISDWSSDVCSSDLVDGRGAAGAGEAVAVDLEQLAGHLDVGEVLAEAGQVLPVDGAAVAVEQAGPGEHVAAGADRPDVGAAAVGLTQPARKAAGIARSEERRVGKECVRTVKLGWW